MVLYRGMFQKCALACLLAIGGLFAQDNYSTWSSSGTIVLNTTSSGANVAANQIGFPVLVRLTTANAAGLIASENSGLKGADVRFAKLDGTHLPYEMIKWDTVNQRAFFWVLLDTVYGNSNSQIVTMYWGKTGAADSSNSAKVFSTANGFIADYHLNKTVDSSNGMHTFKDATGATANGYSGTTVTDTDGAIDRGRAFHQIGTQAQNNNAGDSIIIPGMMGKPRTVTFSAWVRVDSIDQYNTSANGHRANIISIANMASLNDAGATGTGIDSFYMGFKGGANWNNFGYYPSSGNQQTLLHQGWKYVAGSINPTAGYATLFLNGDSVKNFASTDTIAWTATGNTKLGKQGTNDYGEKFGGSMCEVRFENVARSSDWERLCFQNQGATDNLLTVTASPLTAPLLSTPANGSINLAPSLTLGWVAFPSAVSYAVQVSTNSAFSSTVLNAAGNTTVTRAVSGLQGGASYFWHVNATTTSTTTNWSAVWSFTIGLPPVAPVLATPTNGASTGGSSLTLSWGSSAGSTYRLQIATTPTFAATIVDQVNLGTASTSVSGLAVPATFYWRISATNNVGTGPWSIVWSFLTKATSNLPVTALTASPEFKLTSAAVAYTLPNAGEAIISFYDMLGRNVLNITRMQPAGQYSISLTKLNLAAGRYTVQFKAAGVEKRGTVFLTR